jgi:hypothetical protein
MAPFYDRVRDFSPLSACISAGIQRSGTPKRLDASVTNTVNRLERGVVDDSCSACAAPLDSINAAKITTMHSILPTDRKAAIVVSAV